MNAKVIWDVLLMEVSPAILPTHRLLALTVLSPTTTNQEALDGGS